MKNFASSELIAPVVNEIMLRYKPIDYSMFGYKTRLVEREPTIHEWKESLSLYNFHGNPELPFCPVVYDTVSGRMLLKELDEWTKAAETYEGELDRWNDNERKRIAHALAVALIEKAERSVA